MVEEVCPITALPDHLIAAVWPPERVTEGLCVGSADVTRALRSCAPRVYVCSRNIGDRGAEALVGSLALMAGLQELRLDGNRISDRASEALAGALDAATGLRVLTLEENRLETPQGLWSHLPVGLLSLSVGRNRIGAQGAQALGRCLPDGLLFLDISFNALGGSGVSELGPLPHGLLHLSVRGNFIGPHGAHELARHVPGGLLTLNLGFNGLVSGGGTDGGGMEALLQHLPRLQSLSIGGNPLGEDGIRTLLRRLPPGLRFIELGLGGWGGGEVQALRGHLPSGQQHIEIGLQSFQDLAEGDYPDYFYTGLLSVSIP